MFVGTEEDCPVCESGESRGRGLLFTCVRVGSFFKLSSGARVPFVR